MRPALITGATGFVGWHVAKLLNERGARVRVLVRDPKRLRELDAEVVQGDLRDEGSLSTALSGCEVLYHIAADYRLWAKDPDELYASNVAGTRNILKAAKLAGVERIVYTSTVGCVGVPGNSVGDENTAVSENEMHGAYKRSKFQAEQLALKEAQNGLPVVVVNPTAPVGDHDWKPTPTGKIVVDFVQRKMPAYVDTGLNLVDVRDVAAGHLAACERGRSGQRYILGGENLTLQQIFAKLEEISGVPAPKVQIPYTMAYVAGVVSTAWANFSGSEPRAPLDAVKMARKKMWVRHDKASKELGYAPGPAVDALRRAVEWFGANGYV